MAHPWHHALSSVKRWGGKPEDYLPIHQFFDESKQCLADLRHRALRHHTEGIFLAEKVFGATLTNSDGRVIPVRWVGEQHVQEDLGWIPTVKDWLMNLRLEPWMGKTGRLPLSAEERQNGDLSHGQKESSAEPEPCGLGAEGSCTDERGGGHDPGLHESSPGTADSGGLV